MTISSEKSKIQHTTDGVQDTFAFDYLITDGDHLEVYLGDVLQSTGYSVPAAGVGDPLGGNVVFDPGSIPTTGQTLTLKRNTPNSQVTDYDAYSSFPAATHEAALDKLTMITHELEEELGRAVKASISDDGTTTFTLPAYSAGKAITWSTSTQELVNSDFDLATYVSQAQAAQTAAETAQTAAELAETNAETAQTASETARDASIVAQGLSEAAQAASEDAQGYSEEWATKAEDSLISVAAGGDGITDYSSLHHAAKAADSATAAGVAQTAAELAQTNAETAQTAAETAQTAAELAETGAEAAETGALAAQAATEAVYDSFDDRYLGAKASDPTLDNDGNTLLVGALYWNTASNVMKAWSGTVWENITTVTAGTEQFTATQDQMSITVSGTYTYVYVYLNGIRIPSTHYSFSSPTITLYFSLDAGDAVEIEGLNV
jgi:hypothetical protein